MSSFKDTHERIKFATNTKTQVSLAKVLEIKQSSISDAKRRESIPPDWFMKLFKKFGLNPDWLEQGSGPMYLKTEHGYQPQDAPIGGIAEDPAHYGDPMAKSIIATVHKMTGKLCEKPSSTLPVHSKISLPLAFASDTIKVLYVESPNMAPYIGVGSYVGIDTSITDPISGVLFAIHKRYEGIVLNRIFFDTDNNQCILTSDAEGYPESTMSPETLSKHIMGKVCWVLQKI